MKKKIANWGNYPVMESDEKSFAYFDQLQSELVSTDAVIARGNGRCYGDASLEKNTLSTLKYDKILSFDIENGFFECQSGITLDKVLEVIVPKGWFLPVIFWLLKKMTGMFLSSIWVMLPTGSKV